MDYLDEHIDVLYQAAERAIDRLYDRAADSVRQAAAAREKLSGGLAGKLGEPQALEEEFRKELREIAKSLIMEEVEFETRLFQVTLKIQVDRDVGGGIEQKLNRIRAIEGVTVVGHEDVDPMLGMSVIEARSKFHPDTDAIRPGTYITQTLVPEINSSKLVHGVKVIDIVKGSLKRLDK